MIRRQPHLRGPSKGNEYYSSGRKRGWSVDDAECERGLSPVELSPVDVVNRELSGLDPNAACISERFLKSYVAQLLRSYAPGSGKVINLSEEFFRLGPLLDWVGPQRESKSTLHRRHPLRH